MCKFYRSGNAVVCIMVIVAYLAVFAVLKLPFAIMNDYQMSYTANGSPWRN